MTVPVVDLDEAEILSADVFGRMRSPWNVNDREYLSRGLGEMCGIPSTSFCEFLCSSHQGKIALRKCFAVGDRRSFFGRL